MRKYDVGMMDMRRINKNNRTKGQGIVEFALALPIVLVMVFGMVEFGRLLFFYVAINSAAREAARYGISIGDGMVYNGEVTERFYDCDGIRAAAKNIGHFAGVDDWNISVFYDHGPPRWTDDKNNDGWPLDVNYNATCWWLRHWYIDHDYYEPTPVKYGDRVKIYISVTYTPLLSYLYLDVPTFKMRAWANRTIVRNAKIAPAP